jgi:23S rRNA (adenine2503-C2)-methyltransferase
MTSFETFPIAETVPAPAPAGLPALRGMSQAAMQTMLAEAGFETYRAKQLYHWVFAKGAESLDTMKNLPKPLRAWLAEHTRLAGSNWPQ